MKILRLISNLILNIKLLYYAYARALFFSLPDVTERRQKICGSCDQRIKIVNVCGACGCFLSIKQRDALSSCPSAKWDILDDTND